MKWVFKQFITKHNISSQIIQNDMSNFKPLEFVGRGRETQIRVCENIHSVT